MAAIMRQGTHLLTGSDQRQVCGRLWMSLVNPALMEVSELTGEGAASPPSSNGEAVLSSDGEAVLPLMPTNSGGRGRTPFPSATTGEGASPSPRVLHQVRDLGRGVLGLCQRHSNVLQVS